MKNIDMDTISLDAAVAVTGISRSTLWRRVTDGSIGKGGKDGRNRAMLALADVLPLVSAPLQEDDVQPLMRADQGDAKAQADIGALFALQALRDAKSDSRPRLKNSGGALCPQCTSLRKLRNKARRMRCIGWACCTQQDWAKVTVVRWR